MILAGRNEEGFTPDAGQRRCRACRLLKPEDRYHFPVKSDGRMARVCRLCKAAHERWRYRRTADGERRRARQRARYRSNPEPAKARARVRHYARKLRACAVDVR